MGEAAVKIEQPTFEVRRFTLPDLSQHGAWLLPRLLKAFPHLTERTLAGWLTGLVHSNDFLFLFSPNAAGLAQVVRSHTLEPQPVVWERFVFAKDQDSIGEAQAMYTHFAAWANGHGVKVMVIEEKTDVPHEKIKEVLGRLFTRQQTFARL